MHPNEVVFLHLSAIDPQKPNGIVSGLSQQTTMPTPKKCAGCSFRAAYEERPKSLKGRFWRWHIRWCPGWKAYFRSLPPEEQQTLQESYQLQKG